MVQNLTAAMLGGAGERPRSLALRAAAVYLSKDSYWSEIDPDERSC
jgi:hypothetical protein